MRKSISPTTGTNKVAAWTVLGILLSIFVISLFAKNVVDVEKFILRFGVWGPLISILLYGVLSVTPIPTDPLTILNGALFGPLVGILTSWMGNNFAALIEYYLGKGIGTVTDFEENRSKLPFGLGKYPVDSPLFLICGRFLPGYGAKIVSIVGGVYKVSLWRYIWTASVSNLVGSIMFALGGYSILKLF